MTTRYNIKPKTRFGAAPLPSGYEGNSATDFTIPSCGIEDVDRALFELFDKEIPLIVSGENNTENRRCPVIFFAGEKWALNKKLRAMRDRNHALILPICTAVRTSIVQDPLEDITGRGINQQTGEIVIHRQLDKSDREYQGLINRMLLQHQKNLAVNPEMADPGQLTTLRDIGDMANEQVIQQGGLMVANRKNNVYETIVVPSPQFFTAIYEVVLWTQYTAHMTQLIEQVISSQLPQGNCWRLDSPKGYWFLAHVDGNNYVADTNTDDFSQTERVVKYKFTIKVPGYILASKVPGAPVPIKRYVSSPTISFDTGIVSTVDAAGGTVPDPFLGSDDPTLPLDANDDAQSRRTDQRNTDGTRLLPNISQINSDDPALKAYPRGAHPPRFTKITGIDKNGRLVTKLYRIKGTNSAQGETVLDADAVLGGLNIVVTED